MRIDFTAGKVRPTDPVQAAKLSSECGIHIRSRMHVARHWNDYAKSPLKHVIPHAIKDIAVGYFPSIFIHVFTCCIVNLVIYPIYDWYFSLTLRWKRMTRLGMMYAQK